MARPRSDIQERILLAAHARFLAEGVEAASLRNVAKDAETSIGMVYYYYTTKDDLFLAIVEETYQKILADLEGILAGQSSFQERLRGFYARIGAMPKAEQEVVRLIVREALTSHERRDRLMRRFLRGHLPLLMRAILEASAAGEVDEDTHPIVVMACTLGFAGAMTTLIQLARVEVDACIDPATAPDFMRELIHSFAAKVPRGDELAQQLSRFVVRAVSPSSAPDKSSSRGA
jgi:AcrR family transcriptional regulator